MSISNPDFNFFKSDDQLKGHFQGAILNLYNTPSKKKEVFVSRKPWNVDMYSCGPTVYSEAHIGNMRAYIFPDILKKVLENIGYKVVHIINITDVWHLTDDANDGDDKMERQALKKQESVWDISRKCTEAYKRDLERLNIRFPNKFTQATEYIYEQISMIKELEKKGHVYKTSDGIYFNTSTFPSYADFWHLDIENLSKWERVDMGEKRHKTDFALWKFSPKNGTKRQMEWASPWWIGFPGWHIECSAMILDELGEQIDIHTGGTDHIPVHHTNEVAQATCCTWHNPARYWLHGEFLLLDKSEKIGKSKGNSLLLSSLIDKWFDPLSYRYMVLTAHYKSFLTFSEEILKSAQQGLKNLRSEISRLHILTNDCEKLEYSPEALSAADDIMSWLLDDLNTAVALAKLRSLLANKNISDIEKWAILHFFDNILSLGLFNGFSEDVIIPNKITELAKKRWDMKNEKKFQESDLIRQQIEALWFQVNDEKNGYSITTK